ncbi:aldolase/citrate lyase family protein [Rhodococcus sp. RD6.2]|uniref:DUF6986 family protein n=1 Tax=Rhodococcus sp. RD6.2 TaxID=260936 RepID=UPI00067860F0|nr:aldolase/citrate lyase family protein [Rhodococcus sp. RD6.2]
MNTVTVDLDRIDAILAPVDAQLAARYPDTRTDDQPVHTVYVGAAHADSATPTEWGNAARTLLAARSELIADLTDAATVARVDGILSRRPIADLRIDFEDGYGWRADTVEDEHARRAGRTLCAVTDGGEAAPRWCGIRTKGLAPTERRRSIRTLELVLDAAGGVPPGFVFTVPKLRAAEQVPAVVALCEEIERVHGLPERALRFELQIESPQAVIGADGTVPLARAVHLADGRCTGLHYGTYDYSAACGIAPRQQSADHPVADHAKAVMLAAAAQTGVRVSDGSTQVVPEGTDLEVRDALARHFRLVTRALERGYHQGWDIHPGHLVTRWAAVLHFHRAALTAAASRLQAYLQRRGGSVVDEPATAQALAAVVLRGLGCGAYDGTELLALAPDCTTDVLHGLADRTLPLPSPE